jgi:L-threonylcarbamoyladenylate synthase
MTPILDAVAPDTARLSSEKLSEGGLLLYPTDSIYGLGCNALDSTAVQRLYSIKGRNPAKPFLVLLGSFSAVTEFFDIGAQSAILKRLWPGPFTVLLKPRHKALYRLQNSNGRVGVRQPDDPYLKKLLRFFRQPLISTSANLSDRPYVHNWTVLEKLFRNHVDMMVKRHPYQPTIPSAIIEWQERGWIVHREGPLPVP